MSRSRKHVTSQALDEYPIPEEGEKIVKVISIRGSNILEIEYPDGEKVLALMPAKFNKVIWVKRGNYVIAEPWVEQFKTKEAMASKLKARIVHILLPDQVKQLQKSSHWPKEFEDGPKSTEGSDERPKGKEKEEGEGEESEEEDSEEELDEYLVNPNHRVIEDSDSDSDSDSDEDDDSENENENDSDSEQSS